MIRLIEENLVRQNKAMMLLYVLLEEEFSRLNQGNPQGFPGWSCPFRN